MIGDYDDENGNGNDDNDDNGVNGFRVYDDDCRDDDYDGGNNDKISCIKEIFTCNLNAPSETSDCFVSVQISSKMSLVFLFLDGV